MPMKPKTHLQRQRERYPHLYKKPETPRTPERIEELKFYSSVTWQRFRAAYLAQHPLCVKCQGDGRLEAATVLDHVIPRRIARERQLDPTNMMPLCFRCHQVKRATEDKRHG